MADHYNVSTQGINDKLTEANGEYEARELGQKTVEEIQSLLGKFSALTCPDPQNDDDDLCPPSLQCERAGEVFAFMFDGGTIISAETGGEVSVAEAASMLSDTSALDELRKRARIENAPPAVLKTDVEPTDIDKITANDIETGSNAPQFALEVWKSRNARAYTFAPFALGGFLIFVGLVAMQEDTVPAVICLLIGVACFFTRRFVKPWARETLAIGLDWGTNTIWAKRGKKLSFQPNANRFSDFILEKRKSTEEVYNDFDGDGIATSQSVKVVTWTLEGKTSGPEPYTRRIETFLNRKTGEEALMRLKELYASQK